VNEVAADISLAKAIGLGLLTAFGEALEKQKHREA
jgi:hypothetical protein